MRDTVKRLRYIEIDDCKGHTPTGKVGYKVKDVKVAGAAGTGSELSVPWKLEVEFVHDGNCDYFSITIENASVVLMER